MRPTSLASTAPHPPSPLKNSTPFYMRRISLTAARNTQQCMPSFRRATPLSNSISHPATSSSPPLGTPLPFSLSHPHRLCCWCQVRPSSSTPTESHEKQSWEALLRTLFSDSSLPQWGSRRPTEYPTWVTLEVAHGGFATGRAMASFEMDAARSGDLTPPRSNESFLTPSGMEELVGMLDSGCYRTTYPEHSALLAFAQLVRSGDATSARQLLHEIAPYFLEIRFYPKATSKPSAIDDLRVGVATTSDLPKTLGRVRARSLDGTRAKRMALQRDACDMYEPIQAEAVKLLLLSTGSPLDCDNPSWEDDNQLLSTVDSGLREAIGALVTRFTKLSEYSVTKSETTSRWELVTYYEGEQKLTTFKNVEDTNKMYPFKVGRHTKARSSTRLFVEALATAVAPPESAESLSNAEKHKLGNRLRSVIAKRGVIGGNRHDAVYRKQVELSSAVADPVPVFVDAATKETEACSSDLYITERDLPLVQSKIVQRVKDDCKGFFANDEWDQYRARRQFHDYRNITAPIPSSVEKALSRTTARSLSEHVACGAVVSAEGIARCVSELFAAASANTLQDPVLRRLHYSTMSAFNRRRSLLLVNLERQVRVHELPWVAAIAQINVKGGEGETQEKESVNETSAVVDTVRTAAQVWLASFPQTSVPNNFLRAIQNVMLPRKPTPQLDSPVECDGDDHDDDLEAPREDLPISLSPENKFGVPRLLKELATDLFMGEFTQSFPLSTLETAKALRGTTYERYYNLGEVYSSYISAAEALIAAKGTQHYLSKLLLEAATSAKALWGSKEDANTNFTISSGRTLEAVMVLSSHNLLQFYEWLQLDGAVDNVSSACTVWAYIVDRFIHPPGRHTRGYKQVAYAWRQLLFFVSIEEVRLRRLGFDEQHFASLMNDFCAVMEQRVAQSLEAKKRRDRITNEAAKMLRGTFISKLKLVAVEKKPNVVPEGGGARFGDVVLGYFAWKMFPVAPKKTTTKLPSGDDDDADTGDQ